MMDCEEKTAGRKLEEQKHGGEGTADCVENSVKN